MSFCSFRSRHCRTTSASRTLLRSKFDYNFLCQRISCKLQDLRTSNGSEYDFGVFGLTETDFPNAWYLKMGQKKNHFWSSVWSISLCAACIVIEHEMNRSLKRGNDKNMTVYGKRNKGCRSRPTTWGPNKRFLSCYSCQARGLILHTQNRLQYATTHSHKT